MVFCSISNCGNSSTTCNFPNKGITFHKFPKDPDIKDKWISATGKRNWFPTNHSRICSVHFNNEQFNSSTKRRTLIKSAVPTVVIWRLITAQDSASTSKEIKIFCPKCNTEVPHTAEGIQEDQTKILVAKVYHYFEQEYEELKRRYEDLDLTPLSKFRQRTALATGMSETTVLQILKEEEERNAEKRQEPTKKRRKRSRQTDSSSEEDGSDDNVDDGGQSTSVQIAQSEPEIETLVVKLEPPESQKEEVQTDSISAEVKAEPPDDDENNANKAPALSEPAGTKRKARKIPRSDVTSTRQHTQGESSTATAASSVRRTEQLEEQHTQGESSTATVASSIRRTEQLEESGLLRETEVKEEKIETEEGFS